MPRSTYYYEIKRYEEPDKYETIKNEIKMENDKKGYISLIMDEASNEIMGLQVSDSPNFNLVRNTLNELYKNNPCLSGAIIHSHYQLESFRKWIDKQNVLQSMSRKGNYLDNSLVESPLG